MKMNWLPKKQKRPAQLALHGGSGTICPEAYAGGFSLVELLVVIAIIGVLSTFAIGGLRNISKASSLTTTAQRVADQINLARQVATARNLPVEVRVYALPYFGKTTGGTNLYRGMQNYVVDGTNYEAVSRRVLFPERVVIREDGLINDMTNQTVSTNWGEFAQNDYSYRYITIRPDGRAVNHTTTELTDSNNWFTVMNWEQDAPCNSSVPLPKNYAIVQINPFTSKTTVIRP